HRVPRNDLAVAVAAIPDREIAALADHLGHLVRDQGAGSEIPHVMRQHPDPMAVVARKIRIDQMDGDGRRLEWAAAGLLKEGVGEAAQPLMIDSHGYESVRWHLQPSSAECRAAQREGLGRAPALRKATEISGKSQFLRTGAL